MQGTLRPISLQTRNRLTGQVETHSFQVRIPPGATDGRRIRVPGQGEPGQGGGPAGDLFLRVRHAASLTTCADAQHPTTGRPRFFRGSFALSRPGTLEPPALLGRT